MGSYLEAVELLTSKGRFHIELGLDRIRQVLEFFGNPQEDLKFIHVAGTNGKGSVCAMLSAILSERFERVGLYTSPHIFEYTERIKISGKDIPQEIFADYVFEICGKADLHNIHLTEFEILTVMMFLYFKSQNVDVVVLETGLGGRFDATNVISKNLCSIITHIDYDHTERLGKTRDEIAYEKAGIIKQNCPVVTACAMEVLRDRADETNSMFILINPFVNPEFRSACRLKGQHQDENISLAVTAVKEVFREFTDEDIINGLTKVVHPYRFEFFPEHNLIVDVCHNPNGIETLRVNLDIQFGGMQKRFIFGCLKNKDYQKMINLLFAPNDEILFYGFDYPSAATVDELRAVCPYSSKEFDGILKTDDKLTIICGSFYMLNTIKGLKEATYPNT